ncbi:MAG: hypothetical protein COZ56_01165 [Armatimonadetes bacterium CG_4_8_14_3_um_filter_58_9]|nr:MAG: hypothetical protein COZ56_01165 [Armatimonadetes bacterium CG_4_8_14_3_um_filter_58_9]
MDTYWTQMPLEVPKMLAEHCLLFRPLRIKSVALRNRVVLPPMMTNRDIASPEGVEWYRQFAEGGVGLVIVEATRTFRFDRELTAESLKPLVDAAHNAGAAIAIQLFMAPEEGERSPSDLSLDSIRRGIARFTRAACVCSDAGFDGVEPHGAHGFLLNQFFSPKTNARADHYGGDLEGRMRMGTEVVRAVRAAIGDRCLVFYRHTPGGGEEYPLADSLVFATRLAEAGVDVLDLSPSSDVAPADKAGPFKQVIDIPVISVNGMEQHTWAVEALESGRCDLVAIGRGHIADPEWVKKTQEGRVDEIAKCTQCDEGCFGNLRAGKPIGCVQRG